MSCPGWSLLKMANVLAKSVGLQRNHIQRSAVKMSAGLNSLVQKERGGLWQAAPNLLFSCAKAPLLPYGSKER